MGDEQHHSWPYPFDLGRSALYFVLFVGRRLAQQCKFSLGQERGTMLGPTFCTRYNGAPIGSWPASESRFQAIKPWHGVALGQSKSPK